MHARRLVKRSVVGSRVYAPAPTGHALPLAGVVQAVKQESRDAPTGHRCSVYTVLMQDGTVKEFSEEEIALGSAQMAAKGPLKSSLKVRGDQLMRAFVILCGSIFLHSRLTLNPALVTVIIRPTLNNNPVQYLQDTVQCILNV